MRGREGTRSILKISERWRIQYFGGGNKSALRPHEGAGEGAGLHPSCEAQGPGEKGQRVRPQGQGCIRAPLSRASTVVLWGLCGMPPITGT